MSDMVNYLTIRTKCNLYALFNMFWKWIFSTFFCIYIISREYADLKTAEFFFLSFLVCSSVEKKTLPYSVLRRSFFYFLLTSFFFLSTCRYASKDSIACWYEGEKREKEGEKDASVSQYFCNNTTYLWVKRSITATHEAQAKFDTCVRILIHIIYHTDYSN